MDDPQHRTILRALDIAGSQERLCSALWITREELGRYLAGAAVPSAVFLQALDIVAGKSSFDTGRSGNDLDP
jgi:hypothetical protein